jgi:hypothetical protein
MVNFKLLAMDEMVFPATKATDCFPGLNSGHAADDTSEFLALGQLELGNGKTVFQIMKSNSFDVALNLFHGSDNIQLHPCLQIPFHAK